MAEDEALARAIDFAAFTRQVLSGQQPSPQELAAAQREQAQKREGKP